MEKKTIVKLGIAAVLTIGLVGYGSGIGRGGAVRYQLPQPYAADSTNAYSDVHVEMTVQSGKITDAKIDSSGDSDLLSDATREEWAKSIVDNQSAENDVISSASLTYSAASVKEAASDIMVQAGLMEPTPEPTAEPAAEVEAAEGLTDGTYTVQKTTDFSTIDVELTVEDGKVASASVKSEGANDLLTDDNRAAWADQIVSKQAVDTVTGVTVSSVAVQEAVDELLAQAQGGGAEGLTDGTYTVQKTTDFSTIDVELTVEDGKVASASVKSEGANDLLTDDNRAAWADQIVSKQAVDTVTGVTVSSVAVQEAVDELLAQAQGGEASEADARVAELEAALAAAEAKAAEAEARIAELEAAAKAGEAEAAPAGDLVDGTYATRKTTDFSDIDVAITVLNGNVTQAAVHSEGANDLLTDEVRSAWADQIVKDQTVDAVTGVTISSDAVKQAVDELLAEAKGAAEAAPAAASADAGRMMRPRPALDQAAEAEAVAEAPAGDADRMMRPRPALGQAAEAEAEPEAPAGDAGRMMRPRPALDQAAEAEAVAEAPAGDAGRMMRPRPALGQAAEAEAEPEAPAGDAGRMMRPRPALGQAAEAEAVAEAPAGDAGRMMRPRPALGQAAEAEAEPEAAATEAATALSETERLAAIMPYIVTSMGDNKENSYVTDYLEQDPYLVNIYEGYGFAKDYGSARGHEYTLEDLSKTQRPHPKANCITCKTPDLHKMIEEQGVAVYSMPFDEVMPQMTTNVNCYTCHGADNGNNGALVVTHQYVNEALGDNVGAVKPATLSCGQCHIEYYFTPQDSETMMPYDSVEAMTPEAILAYYDSLDFADWTQESTGTRMLKAQHPEMETVVHGKHGALLSCADCHMPTETTDAGVAYRSHLLVSPLENQQLLDSCAKCHGDTDMVAFVRGIQADITARETETGNRLSAMKDALAAAVASGAWSEEDLNAVRRLHREAQWFFDFCYVENSEGAHNTELANRCLETSNAKIDEALALLGVEVAAPATASATPADVVRMMRPKP